MTTQSPEPSTAAGPTVRNATFVIDRVFGALPAQIFNAFADPAVKARWFVGPDRWRSSDHSLDFGAGGREHLRTGTRLIITEQDAFLDGADLPAERERGTRELLDNLAAELRRA